ncbi:MAG: urease accessory protein UreJ [Chloroflexi bacterium]|nr:MAG: urease accessory protein UreJ [Chloroflexota bacterium]
MKSRRLLLILTLLLLLFVLPSMVYAHDETTVARFGSFIAGLTHPILGLDHLLAMLSVGIISAQIGGRAIWQVPATFVGVMALGGTLGLLGVGLTAIEFGIALSVLALGVAIFMEKGIPIAVVMVAVGLFAIFHGYAHGAEMPSLAQPVRYALGFLTGTAVIHITGVLIGDIPSHYKAGPIVLRGLGAVIAVFGILFLVGVL